MKRSQGWQRGGTLVEAAVVVLLLFTFVFAIIEFGRILSVYQTITNAAREGARFSVAPCQSGDTSVTQCSYTGPDGTAYSYGSGFLPAGEIVTAYVTNYLKAGAVPPDSVLVSGYNGQPECWEMLGGSVNNTTFNIEHHCRQVAVATTYHWLFLPFGNLPLRATSVMRDELDIKR